MGSKKPLPLTFGILLARSSPGYAIERSCKQGTQQSEPVSVHEQSVLLQSGMTDFAVQLSSITDNEYMQLYAFPHVKIPHVHPVKDLAAAEDLVSASGFCPLPWNSDPSLPGGINATKQCPHGKLFPGQVTLPNNSSFRQWFSVLYSYVVYAALSLAAIEMIFTGPLQFRKFGTREASFILFAAFIIGITCMPFMQNLGFIGSATRPNLSCNFSCGMPSISSALAIGFLTLSITDASFRVLPKMPRCAEDESEHDATVCDASFWDLLSFIPLSGADMITTRQFCGFLALWVLVFLPVPFARVILQDHTRVQVLVGGIFGAISALIWFGAMRMLQKRYNGQLGQTVCVIFEHNYPLPRYEVKIRCARLLLEGAPDEEVKQAERELQWYTDEGRLEKQMGEVMSRLTGNVVQKPPDGSPMSAEATKKALSQQDSF